jgi:NAD(P)-dependent dehydrogenase (short-subunit alcohol dehydrogenase family)
MRAVMPSMRAAKAGQVFNVTSQLGRVMIPGFGQYSPTKFALEAMSEQFAYETVQHGIDVTIIQPGGYPTKIWNNQAPLSGALKTRTPDETLAAYPNLTARMGVAEGGGGETDPMDVPRAIAEIISMPRGKRPLRRPVHPGNKPQVPINEVSAQQQFAMLGESPFGPWIKDVLG